jgi:hypothetical protein
MQPLAEKVFIVHCTIFVIQRVFQIADDDVGGAKTNSEKVGDIIDIYKNGSAVFDRRCSLTGMIDIRHQSARQQQGW